MRTLRRLLLWNLNCRNVSSNFGKRWLSHTSMDSKTLCIENLGGDKEGIFLMRPHFIPVELTVVCSFSCDSKAAVYNVYT